MGLPTLAIKTEKVKLPVSGKSIEIRPFTVKEQKGMLLAIDNAKNKEKREKIQSLLTDFSQLVQSCIVNDVDLTDLTITDFLFVVMTVRSISVGETTRMLFNCSCGSQVEFDFDLNNITCTNKKKKYEQTLQIDENISITLDILTLKDIMSIEGSTDEEIVLQTIGKSIKKISDSETVYPTKDVESSELMEFVYNLPVSSVNQIKKILDKFPTLVYKQDILCPDGKKEKLEVVDIQDFFS